jgi:hypothetical protein
MSNYNIRYICTIYTRLCTCLMSIPWFVLREKVTLRLLEFLFTSRSKWQPCNISVPLDHKVTKDTRLILNIIYVWKLNQTVLELDIRAVNLCSSLNGINILNIAELDCCQIMILSIHVPSTHAYTDVWRLSIDLPYEKR